MSNSFAETEKRLKCILKVSCPSSAPYVGSGSICRGLEYSWDGGTSVTYNLIVSGRKSAVLSAGREAGSTLQERLSCKEGTFLYGGDVVPLFFPVRGSHSLST